VISVSTFASVLVLVVVTNACAVWLTYTRLTQVMEFRKSTTDNWLRSFNKRLDAVELTISDVKRTAPISLAAEVAGLTEAVARLRATHQRFAGRFDAAMSKRQQPMTFDGSTGEPIDDDELAAELALQRAPNGAPGAR